MKKRCLSISFICFFCYVVFGISMGDVNSSMSIDIVDALLTAQYYVGSNPSGFDPVFADVDSNSTIDIVDALLIARFYVGLITVFPGSTPAPSATPTSVPGGKRVVAYFTSWGIYSTPAYLPSDIPFEKITHINYAFANIVNGEIALGDEWADTGKLYEGDTWDQPLLGNFNQINYVLRQRYPHIKTLISVGGWTWSSGFSDVALTDQSRRKFVSSCVAFVSTYNFDGVDIDWEYPVAGGLSGNVTRPEDKRNFTLLMKELRTALDARGLADGKTYLLTAALTAGISGIENIEPYEISRYLDWLNIMTYDYHGTWETTANHLAPLYAYPADAQSGQLNIDATIKEYIRLNVPASKLVLGIPLYGKGWEGVGGTNNGLMQPGTGAAKGTHDQGTNSGTFDYPDLVGKGYALFRDEAAGVPWVYGAQDRIFISFDDPVSTGRKGDYVNANDLAGIMVWELSNDRSNALITVIDDRMR